MSEAPSTNVSIRLGFRRLGFRRLGFRLILSQYFSNFCSPQMLGFHYFALFLAFRAPD